MAKTRYETFCVACGEEHLLSVTYDHEFFPPSEAAKVEAQRPQMSEKRRLHDRIKPCVHGVSRFSLCQECDFEAAPPQPSAPWPNPETPRTLVKDHGPRIDTTRFPPMPPSAGAEPSDPNYPHLKLSGADTKHIPGQEREEAELTEEGAIRWQAWLDSPPECDSYATFCYAWDKSRAALRASGKGELDSTSRAILRAADRVNRKD